MPRQKLIILSGSPWVGKTAVGKALFESCENSAYLDGDWCWCVNPFSTDDPRLRNGDKGMSCMLSIYLNSGFDYVIFSTVVATYESIREPIIADITAKDFDVLGFTLTCSEETLRSRAKKRDGTEDANLHWLRLPPYPGDTVIDTDGRSVKQIAREIQGIVDAR